MIKGKTGFGQIVEVVKAHNPRSLLGPIKLVGHYKVELIRKGKVIATREGSNDIVNEGLDNILDVMFNNSTQVDPWKMGLIDGSGAQTLSNSDTMSSHAGWAELATYDEANRPDWNPAAASAQSVSNAVQITFTMNATDTIHGVFISTDGTKSGTTGTLWATAPFASELSVVATDEVKVTYTVTAARG